MDTCCLHSESSIGTILCIFVMVPNPGSLHNLHKVAGCDDCKNTAVKT